MRTHMRIPIQFSRLFKSIWSHSPEIPNHHHYYRPERWTITRWYLCVNLENSMVIITNYIMHKGENENENNIHMSASSVTNKKGNECQCQCESNNVLCIQIAWIIRSFTLEVFFPSHSPFSSFFSLLFVRVVVSSFRKFFPIVANFFFFSDLNEFMRWQNNVACFWWWNAFCLRQCWFECVRKCAHMKVTLIGISTWTIFEFKFNFYLNIVFNYGCMM